MRQVLTCRGSRQQGAVLTPESCAERLGKTDAAIVGRHAGTTLMVARYAVNTVKEVQTSLSRFEQNGIQVKGVILNSIFRRATGYQDYGYYEYEYKSDSK